MGCHRAVSPSNGGEEVNFEVLRNTGVLPELPPPVAGGVGSGQNRRPRGGLRRGTTEADGASRSRFRAFDTGGSRRGPFGLCWGAAARSPLISAHSPGVLPAMRGEPAVRRNRPPEHRRLAGRRGPSDGGSRVPIGQGVCVLFCLWLSGCFWLFGIRTADPGVEAADPGVPTGWGTRAGQPGCVSLALWPFEKRTRRRGC